MLSGMYVGAVDATALKAAQSWLGQKVDMMSTQFDRSSWGAWKSSIDWATPLAKAMGPTPFFSVPLFANGGNLKDAANHLYDQNYVYAAQKFVSVYGKDATIIVRTGEEFSGNWFGWSAAKDPVAFQQAYRNFVDAFRTVSGNFKFEWNVAINQATMDPAKAYPGDKYVDFVGGDFYWDSKQSWSTTDPVAAFRYAQTGQYGLQWLENFAAAHGKQTAYSEWGVNSDKGGAYIALVKAWFATHDVAYANYWESNEGFAGKLENGRYGATSDVYKALFGSSSVQTYVVKQWTGTAGNDYVGQEAANLKYAANGGAGNDMMAFAHGDNTVSGGAGNDTIYVGNGKNIIYGNTADATAAMADGNDTIVAGSGSNMIYGNAGNDRITVGSDGSTGANRLDGGTGDDIIIIRGAGANSALGGDGNDRIDASLATGVNALSGGAGNDVILAGAGRDTLIGDAGNDQLVAGRAVGHVDVMTGGAGADVFDFSAPGAGLVARGANGASYQQITDFMHGTDDIDLSLKLQSGDLLRGTGKDFTSVDTAQVYAQQLLDGHGGYNDVAALNVGSATYLFYHDGGTAGAIDSVLRLDGVSAATLDYKDFI